ncbi:MAG: response regulator, partial [Gammaproteobacteria bacterium]|nr:response regulator [Gammaproteobacteria bacterium]
MSELEQVEILLVEDDESDAEMTIRCLTRVKLANNLVWVRDGAEALEFIFAEGAYSGRATGKPRLILLDLKMPRVDGIEVLSRIKADPRTRNIPVVMLTSSSVESDLVRSYALGVNS